MTIFASNAKKLLTSSFKEEDMKCSIISQIQRVIKAVSKLEKPETPKLGFDYNKGNNLAKLQMLSKSYRPML